MHKNIRVGITMGDPSGIGPEVVAKALPALCGDFKITVIGDRKVFLKASGNKAFASGSGFLDMKNVPAGSFSFGKIRPSYGKASIEYLDAGLRLLKRGDIDCLVTAPISKEAVNLAGYKFSGHTEYLSISSGRKNIVMMLLNKYLKIGLATRHIPLRQVPLRLKTESLVQDILLTIQGLERLFALKRPRLVVCGLNPHASDNGLIGSEEGSLIAPAVIRLKRQGRSIEGPLPADIAIYRAFRGSYDAAVAMYHDQALIALKLTGKDSGVNLTLGLPFVRTSPLHGTAFDIAGRGIADPSSMIEAAKLAVKCAANLRKHSARIF